MLVCVNRAAGIPRRSQSGQRVRHQYPQPSARRYFTVMQRRRQPRKPVQHSDWDMRASAPVLIDAQAAHLQVGQATGIRGAAVLAAPRIGAARARRRACAGDNATTAQQRAPNTTLAATRRHRGRSRMVAADCAWFRSRPESVAASGGTEGSAEIARVNLLDLGLARARGWGADADDGTGGARLRRAFSLGFPAGAIVVFIHWRGQPRWRGESGARRGRRRCCDFS